MSAKLSIPTGDHVQHFPHAVGGQPMWRQAAEADGQHPVPQTQGHATPGRSLAAGRSRAASSCAQSWPVPSRGCTPPARRRGGCRFNPCRRRVQVCPRNAAPVPFDRRLLQRIARLAQVAGRANPPASACGRARKRAASPPERPRPPNCGQRVRPRAGRSPSATGPCTARCVRAAPRTRAPAPP